MASQINIRELLEDLMADKKLSAAELDELISTEEPEGQLLEYKHGKVLQKPGKAPQQLIREYVLGFANAEGGILIVGVDNEKWEVTGAEVEGRRPLNEWASDCLQQYAPSFSPFPRFLTVEHEQGEVLVIATHRAPSMIPSTVSGQIRYFLRIHEKTVEAPDYLISDLLLGRRQIPQLLLRDIHGVSTSAGPAIEQLGDPFQFVVVANVENASLTWAERVRIGIIGLSTHEPKGIPEVSRNLLSFVDVIEPTLPKHLMYLRHNDSISTRPAGTTTLAPFDTWRVTLPGQFAVVSKRGYRWRAAIYILARNMPPVWYQVTGPAYRFFDEFNKGELEYERMDGERPTISFEPS